jgi:hypothetical protein
MLPKINAEFGLERTLVRNNKNPRLSTVVKASLCCIRIEAICTFCAITNLTPGRSNVVLCEGKNDAVLLNSEEYSVVKRLYAWNSCLRPSDLKNDLDLARLSAGVDRPRLGLTSRQSVWKSARAVNQRPRVAAKELEPGHGRGKSSIPTRLVICKLSHGGTSLSLIDEIGV